MRDSSLLGCDCLVLLDYGDIAAGLALLVELALGLDDGDGRALAARSLLGQQSLVVALLLVDMLHHALPVLLISIHTHPLHPRRHVQTLHCLDLCAGA